MEGIIEELKNIQDKIEDMDDPTAPELYRRQIGKAHCFLKECIEKIEEI